MEKTLVLTPGQFVLLQHSTGSPISNNLKAGPVTASAGAGGDIDHVRPFDDGSALWVTDWEDGLRLIACVPIGEVPDFSQLHELALQAKFIPITTLMSLEPANEHPI